jgi:hypothetical protein
MTHQLASTCIALLRTLDTMALFRFKSRTVADPLAQRNFDQLEGELAALGGMMAFVPVWSSTGTQPAIGNGTISGQYTQVGKLVLATWLVIPGSTTTFGTGSYNLTLPVPAAVQRYTLGVDLLDTGTQHYEGQAIVNGNVSTTKFDEVVAGSNATGPAPWAQTTPFTFGNGDRIIITGFYEAA